LEGASGPALVGCRGACGKKIRKKQEVGKFSEWRAPQKETREFCVLGTVWEKIRVIERIAIAGKGMKGRK